MITFSVGGIIKSKKYDWFDGATIIRIFGNTLYFKRKNNYEDHYSDWNIREEIKKGNIKYIPSKITNWMKRFK